MSVLKAAGPETLPRPAPTVRKQPAGRPARPQRRSLPLLFRWPLFVFGFAAPWRRFVVQDRAWSRRTAALVAPVASANLQAAGPRRAEPPQRPARPSTAPF